MKTLEQVKIVEYHEGLAKQIAKMWNESRENWGGDASVTTEQEVKEKEENSTNLHLFLAMVGEEVVGYCGLSEYKEDEGALYIPLLNVHPAYHGLKIGKQLVLKAVEKTIELGWPRLDLFTWPGNTKAVPLYKKCGFFWEERDNTTHLMNFIPLVLQIDWLKPFFEKHDWYSTSQRPIEVKPDGIKENGYTFYEYKWQVGEEFVRIQIERTGRGIRLIETNDIVVQMEIPDFKLLEKEEHLVSYKAINKTEVPFHASIEGLSSGIVDHNFHEEFDVVKEVTIQHPVELTMPQTEPSPWKTHPVVGVNLVINGQEIPLKMGVFPKKAGKLYIRSIQKNWSVRQKGMLFLDIENQLDEEATWIIKLPLNNIVKWEQSEVKVTIKGKATSSISLPVQIMKNEFLSEEIDVTVERANGIGITFSTKPSLALPGLGAKFGGETNEHWYGYNGPFYIKVEKRNHIVKIGSIRSKQEPITFFTPQLGKPFSEEFSKKEAISVEYIERPEAFVLKTTLKSDAFAPLLLHTHFKIYGDGTIEINHEIVNDGLAEMNNLAMLQPLMMPFNGLAIPQKDGVMVGKEAIIPFIDYVRDKDIFENWIFTSSSEGETVALSWPKQAKGRKDAWRFAIEYSVKSIGSGEKVDLGLIHIGVNSVSTWKQWRELVVAEDAKPLIEKPIYALEPNGGDFISIIGDKVDYSFRSLLNPYVHGSLTVIHEGETFSNEAKIEEGTSEIHLQLEHQTPGVNSILGKFRSPSQSAEMKIYHLVQGNTIVEITNNNDNWLVNNGVICFKASTDYFNNIYSLTYKGREAFHHQYPEVGPKAWWNPWGGGLRYMPKNVSAYSIQKEKTTIEKVTKVDQHGHSWSGLCLTTTFTEHEIMKGAVLRQYAITLPEIPIVAFYCEVVQASGRVFSKELLELEAFFKPSETLASCYVSLPADGIFDKYYAGVEEFILKNTDYVTIGSDERDEKLTVIHSRKKATADVYLNQDVLLVGSSEEWSAASGDVVKTNPTVLIYSNGERPPLHQFYQLSFQ